MIHLSSDSNIKSNHELAESQKDVLLSPTVTVEPTIDTVEKIPDFVRYPVSKDHSIDEFTPIDLVTIPNPYATRQIRVSQLILDDLVAMIDHAKRDGITLKVVSGYRSYEEQRVLFASYIAQERNANPMLTHSQLEAKVNRYSAKPGHSEHQLGTTIDISSEDISYDLIADENLQYAKWLEANARQYNFKISFPKDNSEYMYEPWHLRWYGEESE